MRKLFQLAAFTFLGYNLLLPYGILGKRARETPEEAALRKLEEETGYTAEGFRWIGRFSWAPGTMGGTVEISSRNLSSRRAALIRAR